MMIYLYIPLDDFTSRRILPAKTDAALEAECLEDVFNESAALLGFDPSQGKVYEASVSQDEDDEGEVEGYSVDWRPIK